MMICTIRCTIWMRRRPWIGCLGRSSTPGINAWSAPWISPWSTRIFPTIFRLFSFFTRLNSVFHDFVLRHFVWWRNVVCNWIPFNFPFFFFFSLFLFNFTFLLIADSGSWLYLPQIGYLEFWVQCCSIFLSMYFIIVVFCIDEGEMLWAYIWLICGVVVFFLF